MSGNDVLLKVRDLKTYFRTSEGTAKAVDGISFDVRKGETLAIVGESGCGKSVTALSIIQLLQKPAGYIAGGSIEYNGKDIVRIPEVEKRQLRGNEISMIFQEPMTSLNPVFTVGTQITEVLKRHQNMNAEQARVRAIEMLNLVKIPEAEQRFKEYPHQLSGGMKQRVMIAMALACRPGLLIADEPTTALDVTIQDQILSLMRDLRQEFDAAVLLITHDLGVVAENADRIAVMYAGRIVEQGDLRTVLQNPSHPYTVKLLDSLPSGRKRDEALQTIEGRVPLATRFPDGCRFAERCHKVMDKCREIVPQLIEIGERQKAACILYDEKEMGRKVEPSEVREKAPPRPRSEGKEIEEALLEVRDLKLWFPIKRGVFKRTVGHVRAVDGTDLTIRKGHTMALVGESGCGKTMLGKSVLQLIPPTGGEVRYAGVDLAKLSRAELKPYRSKLQIIFQDPFSSLNPRMMVGEILMEGMATHGIGANREERTKRCEALMEKVGLDPVMIHRYPHEFSGGQRQRIAIARALAVEPEFIVCDEATSALDVSVQAQIINLLKLLQADLNLTYLFITHDLSVVEYLADEVAVMYLGRIIERGTTEEIFGDPKHPYTRALLSAIPKVDAETGVKKIRLAGDVPSPVRPPAGCHFHPRCADRKDECDQEYPGEFMFGKSHACRCFLYREQPADSDQPSEG